MYPLEPSEVPTPPPSLSLSLSPCFSVPSLPFLGNTLKKPNGQTSEFLKNSVEDLAIVECTNNRLPPSFSTLPKQTHEMVESMIVDREYFRANMPIFSQPMKHSLDRDNCKYIFSKCKVWWCLCQYVIKTSWRAPNIKGAGWQGFWREHFCRTWREDLCHFTHQLVSCLFLFRAMENPPTSAAELDSDPDSPHLDQFPLGQQRFPLGLYHSLHNHLRHPDDRRPGRKGGVLILILLLASHRSKATASCRRFSLGAFRGVANFVHGKMDEMHVWSTASSSTFKAFPHTRAFYFTLPLLFCILASQVFNFFSSDRHFSSVKFSFGWSWPFYFFFIFVVLSVLSSMERLHIRLVLFGDPCKTYQQQSVGKRWNESPFSLPSEHLAHPNTQQVLTILKVLTGYRLA